MAQNYEKEDYKMQMYEAQADCILQQEEIKQLRQELRLRDQQINDSLELRRTITFPTPTISAVQGSSNVENSHGLISIETSSFHDRSIEEENTPSFEEKVSIAISVITKKLVSLENNVRELSERVRKELEMKMDSMKKEMSEQHALCHHANCLVTESNKMDDEILVEEDREIVKLTSPIQIVVMGGNNSNDIFLLDYHEKTWKELSINLPYKVKGHGTVILDDELYVIGGFVDTLPCSTLYRLNKKMKWEKLADMQEKRAYITNSCLVHNGNIWVIGGWNGTTSLNTIEKYDPATNRWEMKPAMKRRRNIAAAAVINNKIYVCGGWNGSSDLDSVEVFDIDSEVWTDFCRLPEPRDSLSITVDGTSIILIGGENVLSIEKTVWKMDVEKKNKKWINLPPLNESRRDSSAVRIETGSILVFGGKIKGEGMFNYFNPISSAVEIFDGQKWDAFPPLPQSLDNHTSLVLTPAMETWNGNIVNSQIDPLYLNKFDYTNESGFLTNDRSAIFGNGYRR